MSQETPVLPTQSLPRRGRGWLRALLIGLGLFVAATVVMALTNNLNLYPTVILIGNFLVPVVFVAFLYDHQQISGLSPDTVATSFCVGGILGVLEAAILESLLLPLTAHSAQGLSLGGAFLVGLIEEGCKIIAVAFLARRMSHDSQMDGLLLGGAVGMGFAAFESTGYAFMALLTSHGKIEASIVETIVRGLLAPFGHGVWTGILGAVLFSQSKPHRFRITLPVILTYLFVSVLHGLWDGLPNALYFVLSPGVSLSVTTLGLAVIGIVTLCLLYRRAMQRQMRQLIPEYSTPEYS
jgi:protease PrsW